MTPAGAGITSNRSCLIKGAPKYSYGLAVPIAGVIVVLFHNPPPEYIWLVNIPGMSDAGAIVQGSNCLVESLAMAEITWSGKPAPISV